MTKDSSKTKSRSDLIFVYAAYTLRYLYLLLLIPFYGRVLGVEGYAVVLAAMSLMAIVWRFVDWGFQLSACARLLCLRLPNMQTYLANIL